MRAMILAAGLGTRLQPLTHDVPKALIRVGNRTLLEHAVHTLTASGCDHLMINVHHHASQVIEAVETLRMKGYRIEISDERNELLDTGGGLKHAGWFFRNSGDFIVYNVDVICNMDLRQMVSCHKNQRSLVTLAVRKRASGKQLLFDTSMRLRGWKNTKTGEVLIPGNNDKANMFGEYAFSGIHVISPRWFDLVTESGAFSLIPVHVRLSEHHRITGYPDMASVWFDAGKPSGLKAAKQWLEEKNPSQE